MKGFKNIGGSLFLNLKALLTKVAGMIAGNVLGF